MEKKKQRNFWPIEGVTRKEVVRSLNDSKLNFLRTQKARRLLVLAVSTMLVLEAGFSLLPGLLSPIFVLIGALLLIWGYLILRSSVRSVADSPDELLDERQIAVRDRTYLHSYRILVTLVTLGFVAASVGSEIFNYSIDFGEQGRMLTGPIFAAIMLLAGLPNMVLAWTTKDN